MFPKKRGKSTIVECFQKYICFRGFRSFPVFVLVSLCIPPLRVFVIQLVGIWSPLELKVLQVLATAF